MTKQAKLLVRFKTKPKDFSFSEMKKLLAGFGYNEFKTGKSSGSRVVFHNSTTNHIIRLHRPHPATDLKRYQLDLVEEELKKQGIIK